MREKYLPSMFRILPDDAGSTGEDALAYEFLWLECIRSLNGFLICSGTGIRGRGGAQALPMRSPEGIKPEFGTQV